MTSKQNKGTNKVIQLDEKSHGIDMYFDAVFNNLEDPIFVKDKQCRFVLVNNAFCKIFRLSKSDIIGKKTIRILTQSARDIFLSPDKYVLVIAKEEKGKREDELVIANKELAFQNVEKDKRANELITANHKLALKNEENEYLLKKLKRAASVFTSADESIMITDVNGVIIEVNAAFSRITGYDSVEVLGKHPIFLQSKCHPPEFYTEMQDELLIKGHWRGERWSLRKNGEIYPEMVTVSTVKSASGDLQHFIYLSTDITELKAYQGQLENIAHYDMLTNLPNRVLLADRLSQAMVHCQRRNRLLVVAFMDLDGFKEVNDKHGHDVGDKLLITLSQHMKDALREGDTLARIGGDEFIAIMVDLESIHDIRSALEKCEFVLHYQPKVNMHTGKVIGVEALIRWQHHERGLILPLECLPVIEDKPISLELGEWVIDNALTQISQWQSMKINLPISINISASQLQKDNFTTRLAALLAAHPEVNPSHLELEMLETSMLEDISKVSATMDACHKLGVCFALDDFGTGYSSLTHLRRLPAKLIKIDQSFVRDMLEDPEDCAIVEGIIGLAKAFRRDVIAEGVETIAHGVALLQRGCEMAQGYGIARPMLADDIPKWLCNWKTKKSWSA
jgi:diguanylate cyclase (GGDEF)-like protein/PAS domain S-box-containing protein